MIQVIVCSPIPALRAGLSALLSADPEVAVRAAVSSIRSLDEDPGEPGVLVVTDGALPGDDLEALPGWSVLLVGEEFNQARALAGRPAWGILSPDASPEALQAAVRALHEGLVAASPALVMQLLTSPEETSPRAALPTARLPRAPLEEDELPPEALTGREIDVLRLAAQGLTNKQIAVALKISEHTVKFHISAVFSKLGVSNRAEAVRKGARWGWIPL